MTPEAQTTLAETIFAGGGEIGALMRAHDWSNTPLGPVENWSLTLRAFVSNMLAFCFPQVIFWGEDYIQLYNDAMIATYGPRHPEGLGRPVYETWSEVWEDQIKPICEDVKTTGEAVFAEEQRHDVLSFGYMEETYFTRCYSPIRDETGKISGIACTSTETTKQVVRQRRLMMLRELATDSSGAKTLQSACCAAAETLNPSDIPFALFYQINPQGNLAERIASSGLTADSAAAPLTIALNANDLIERSHGWPLAEVLQSREPQLITDVVDRFGALSGGPWAESPRSALILPILSSNKEQVECLLIAGISPRLQFSSEYRSFLELVAQQVASSMISATRTMTPTAMGGSAYGEEALRWLPKETGKGREDEDVVSSLSSPSSSLSPASKAHILLVDDNADMREYVKRLLSQRWQVETTTNGAIALNLIQQHPPDLVLSDVRMPELDGLQLLQALRTHPQTKSIPVILLSARAGEEAVVEGLEAGANDYLIKSFSARELVARVETHLQLARLRQELSTNRFKDEFLMTLTHELQAPLTAILGWSRLLQSQSFNPATTARALATIERNATIEAKLIKDLLEVSSMLSGKPYLKSQIVDLAALVRSVTTTFRKVAQAKQIQLIETIADAVPSNMFADGDRLKQVIASLLENAIKFTPERGQVHLQVACLGSNVLITVSDTGIGIRPDFLPYVFDRFTQAEVPSRHTPGGVGIGLAIARHLVELHKGTIEVASEGEGQGATFTVRLPFKNSTQPNLDARLRE